MLSVLVSMYSLAQNPTVVVLQFGDRENTATSKENTKISYVVKTINILSYYEKIRTSSL